MSNIVLSDNLDNPKMLGASPYFMQVMNALQCDPSLWTQIVSCPARVIEMNSCFRGMEERCKTLEGQCELLLKIVRYICCSANINFSQLTIDDLSDDGQVNIDQIVQNFPFPNFVNAFPLTPGKSIRLQHGSRPGWTPREIRIDMALSGGNVNYLDFKAQFYIGPGDLNRGKSIGSLYYGNQFLNKDGTQIRLPFPKYKGEPIDIGSLERLAVEITNSSAGVNLDSAQVIVLCDNDRFYKMCSTAMCKPGCAPGCDPGC